MVDLLFQKLHLTFVFLVIRVLVLHDTVKLYPNSTEVMNAALNDAWLSNVTRNIPRPEKYSDHILDLHLEPGWWHEMIGGEFGQILNASLNATGIVLAD